MKIQQKSNKRKSKDMLESNWGIEEEMRKELFLLENYMGTKVNEWNYLQWNLT